MHYGIGTTVVPQMQGLLPGIGISANFHLEKKKKKKKKRSLDPGGSQCQHPRSHASSIPLEGKVYWAIYMSQ
jgi:hypothetical protein